MSNQFDSIMDGLNDILEYAKGDKTRARSRIREIPMKIKPVKSYSKDDIKNIRLKFNLTQRACT